MVQSTEVQYSNGWWKIDGQICDSKRNPVRVKGTKTTMQSGKTIKTPKAVIEGEYRLYHQTDPKACRSIAKNGMKPGTKGLVGPGIYFGQDPKDTQDKARHCGCMVTAHVTVGNKPKNVQRSGSANLLDHHPSVVIHGRKSGLEYVVRDPKRVKVVDTRLM